MISVVRARVFDRRGVDGFVSGEMRESFALSLSMGIFARPYFRKEIKR